MTNPLWDQNHSHNNDDKVIGFSFLGTRWFMIVLSILAGLLGVAILYYLFSPSSLPIEEEPPTIEAEQVPYKVKPENPGGVNVPHQDKNIFDVIAKDDNGKEEVEVLIPSEEAPVEKVVFTPPKTESKDDNVTVQVEDIAPVSEEKVEIKIAPNEENPSKHNDVKTSKTPTHKPHKTYMAQVASMRSQALAEKEWSLLKRQHPHVLAEHTMNIERVDLKKKGVYYRVHVGPFSTKSETIDFCKKLKAKGASCWPMV